MNLNIITKPFTKSTVFCSYDFTEYQLQLALDALTAYANQYNIYLDDDLFAHVLDEPDAEWVFGFVTDQRGTRDPQNVIADKTMIFAAYNFPFSLDPQDYGMDDALADDDWANPKEWFNF